MDSKSPTSIPLYTEVTCRSDHFYFFSPFFAFFSKSSIKTKKSYQFELLVRGPVPFPFSGTPVPPLAHVWSAPRDFRKETAAHGFLGYLFPRFRRILGLEIWARYFRNDEMELVEIERTVCDAVSIGSNKLVHFAVPLLK